MSASTSGKLVFHDERQISKQWLYHGYLICSSDQIAKLGALLLEAKKKSNCEISKRIHFSELRSSSQISTRTMTAKNWIRLFVDEVYDIIWFYLFGINLYNVDYTLFGPAKDGNDRQFRIYNRFFEIGMYSAFRYFFKEDYDVRISGIYSEARNLEKNNPFLRLANKKINNRESNIRIDCKEITQVDAKVCREKNYPETTYPSLTLPIS